MTDEAPPKAIKSGKMFSVAVAASVALHLAAVGLYYLPWPEPRIEPPPEETVQVEMVPEPEPQPEPEQQPEPEKQAEAEKEAEKPPEQPEQKAEAAPEAAQEQAAKPPEIKLEDMKPAQDTPAPEPTPMEEAQALQRPPSEMKPVEEPPQQVESNAFEARAQQGETADGGDPAADTSSPQTAPDPIPAETAAEEGATDTPQPAEQADAQQADQRQVAAPPELDLPQTNMALDTVDQGEALIETVPKPAPRPQRGAQDSGMTATAENAVGSGTRPEPKKVAQLLANNVMDDPRVRAALRKLPRERRIVQMCMIETLEQIRHAMPNTLPEGLFFDPRNGSPVSGERMTADGAAYKFDGGWQDVDFRCSVNANADAITDFSFVIGGRVPKGEWKSRRFPGS